MPPGTFGIIPGLPGGPPMAPIDPTTIGPVDPDGPTKPPEPSPKPTGIAPTGLLSIAGFCSQKTTK
ncbi:hypothetical protein DOY81_002513 [Sarcophaga bullata]|nr:hypothetical protein DOY81_002513 [Sarcophaga bullata]